MWQRGGKIRERCNNKSPLQLLFTLMSAYTGTQMVPPYWELDKSCVLVPTPTLTRWHNSMHNLTVTHSLLVDNEISISILLPPGHV